MNKAKGRGQHFDACFCVGFLDLCHCGFERPRVRQGCFMTIEGKKCAGANLEMRAGHHQLHVHHQSLAFVGEHVATFMFFQTCRVFALVPHALGYT